MITNSLFVQYVSFSLCFSFSKTATAACRLSNIAGCFSIHTKKEPRIWQNIKQNPVPKQFCVLAHIWSTNSNEYKKMFNSLPIR